MWRAPKPTLFFNAKRPYLEGGQKLGGLALPFKNPSEGVIDTSKKRETIFLGILFSLVLAHPIGGHVILIHPEGGETFNFGNTVNVQWQTVVEHEQENWDLYFSPDGGVNWEVIESDLDPVVMVYQWTVPQVETDRARIRIYMDNVAADYDDSSDDFTIQDAQASVHVPGEFPLTPELYPNYPNPFNPVTTVRYALPGRTEVVLAIYDILGRKVRTLVRGMEGPGVKSVTWDGTSDLGQQVRAGVYLYRVKAGSFSQTRKMLLLK